MAGVSSVIIKIGAETASAVGAIKNVDRALGETQTSGQKLQAGIRKAAVPAAAAFTVLAAAAVSSAKAAADDAASRQLLDSQLQRSLHATKAVTDANEDWIDAMSRSVAVADDELRPALGQAVRATGDLAQAHDMLQLALDTSAATGKPLGSVVTALGKAYNGSATSLKKLVPSISDAAIASGDYSRVQAELNAQVEGAAKGQAETAAGQYKAMQISMQELQETIGAALLPAMQALVPAVTAVVGVFAGHPGVILAVAGAVGAFAAAVLIANGALSIYTATMTVYEHRAVLIKAATRAWAAAQWLLNVAMDANPIGLAIVAVAALTAGVILAYRHSSTFRAIVQGAFSAAKQAASVLLPIVRAIVGAFQDLWRASGSVRSALVSAMGAIRDAIEAVARVVESLIGAIGRIHFPSKPDWVPFSVPAGPSVSGAAVGGTGPVINVSISGAIDPESTALAIRRVLTRYDRRHGQRPLGGQGAWRAGG